MHRYRVAVTDPRGQRLVDACDMDEEEARNVLWTFVRKATDTMERERVQSVFAVHAFRYDDARR